MAFAYDSKIRLTKAKVQWWKKIGTEFKEFDIMLKDSCFQEIYVQCQRRMPNQSEDIWFIMTCCQYIEWYKKVQSSDPLRFKPFLKERFGVQLSKYVEDLPLIKLAYTEEDSE